MDKLNQDSPLFFYMVSCPKYDSSQLLHGRLSEVRRYYFESSIASQESVTDYSEGLPVKYSHSISRWGLRWKKKVDGVLRERSCFDPAGVGIQMYTVDGFLYGKMVFGKDLNWLKTSYYEKGASSQTPSLEIERDPQDTALILTEYEEGEKKTTRLQACACVVGSPQHSVLRDRLGPPMAYAATNQGDFCYYPARKAREYRRFLDALESGQEMPRPVWKETEVLSYADGEEWEPSSVSLQSGQKQAQAASGKDLPPLEELGSLHLRLLEPEETGPVAEPFALEGGWDPPASWEEDIASFSSGQQDSEPVLPQTEGFPPLEETKAEPSDRYAANRELFHVDTPAADGSEEISAQRETLCRGIPRTPEPPDPDIREIIEIIEDMEEQPEMPEPRVLPPLSPDGSAASRYTVAGKKRNSEVVHASPELFRKTLYESFGPAKPDAPMDMTITAAKRIVVSAEESYLYFGKIINGLRHGRGRTQGPDGMTSYEGEYRKDKRHGFGAYYYKSGKLCYAGEWNENLRDGVGVSFHPTEDGIHVGRWDQDVPAGPGAVFDGQGNLEFAGRIENGRRQGVGVTYQAEDGTVFVGKWKDGKPTGQGSAFDPEGNLIYTGGWKDGKRHGTGTEFSADGQVVFTGEWKDDAYLSGILYKRVQKKPE